MDKNVTLVKYYKSLKTYCPGIVRSTYLFILVNINVLEFSSVGLHSSIDNISKLFLVLINPVPGDISELRVLAYLVLRPGAVRLSVDVNDGRAWGRWCRKLC